MTDSIAVLDPVAALDAATSWTDNLLAGLNSLDLALPGVDSATAAVATVTTAPAEALAGAVDSPTTGVYDIPIDLQTATAPTVQATIGGGSPTNLLVDTGSSLAVPFTNFDGNSYNFLTGLDNVYDLGIPVGLGESSTGGVDYLYLTYDGVSVDYGAISNGEFTDLTTNVPVHVEVYSRVPNNFGTRSPMTPSRTP